MDTDAKFNGNVTYSITLGFELYQLDLKYTGYDEVNSKIKVQNKRLINIELGLAVGVVEGIISGIFEKGHSISGVFAYTPLCWLNIDQILLKPNYEDTSLWGGVTPAYSPERCPDNLPFGKWTFEELTHPKEII